MYFLNALNGNHHISRGCTADLGVSNSTEDEANLEVSWAIVKSIEELARGNFFEAFFGDQCNEGPSSPVSIELHECTYSV